MSSHFSAANPGSARTFAARDLVFNSLFRSRVTSLDRRWRRCRPRDAVEDGHEQSPRHGHLGELERNVLRVPRRLGPDLDELLPQRYQRSILYWFRQCQPPQEVAKVIGQCEQLLAGLVVRERAARELRPFHAALFLP